MFGRVLVTGATGFAGQHLGAYLYSLGYEVFGTSYHNNGPKAYWIKEIFAVDLRLVDNIQRVIEIVVPDYVVHLAAVAFVAHQDVSEIYQTNILGARNLLVALEKAPRRPRSVVMVSSANIYGNSSQGQLFETEQPRPENDYAVSKVAMEMMSAQFSRSLDIVIARPFNYTGRGQSVNFLVPKIVDHFRRGADSIELGNVDVFRDFSDVRSVVKYLARLMKTPEAAGQIFNICTGRATSLRTIIETCEQIAARKIAIQVNPKFVRDNEIKILLGSPDKLHAAVGAVDEPSLDATLAWMLEA